ncbi:Uma2 family endonuclease [Nocardia sp. A7]|uniref:Uma2 family endonuclease n=1 Tax=Nocardia sp. A7 TaxID=2789274 RepID=UPI00397D7649
MPPLRRIPLARHAPQLLDRRHVQQTLTARIPDVVVNRCLEDFGQLTADRVFIVVEVVSPWSKRRDRIHKMADYADAGIPHYWIVEFDKVGAVSVERYALEVRKQAYTHVEPPTAMATA